MRTELEIRVRIKRLLDERAKRTEQKCPSNEIIDAVLAIQCIECFGTHYIGC